MKYARVPVNAHIDFISSTTWRPWTLRKPFLIAFIALCILLTISIELTIHACAKTGCYVFGQHSDTHIPRATYFAYNQLPTVFGLALSLIWALPHHDLMRLEPFFQMSKRSGAAPSDSLFLQYTYTFPPFIPFRAVKRRHFVVFLSSAILLLMNFITIPLISSIFEDKVLTKGIHASATRSRIYTGNYNLSAGFSYMAYDYAWLNGSLPPFTTAQYALLPVRNSTGIVMGNETWQAETTLFEADLECERAPDPVVDDSWDGGLRLNITSNNGAHNFTICDSFNPRRESSHCDLWTTFRTNWTSLANQTSSWKNGSAGYLYAWAFGADPSSNFTNDSFPQPRNITALFCKTSYYSQTVIASFAMPAGQVIDVERIGPRVPFTNVANFDRVINGDFEAAIPNKYRDTQNNLVGFGYPPQQLPNVDSKLVEGLGRRRENASYFGYYGSQSSVYMHSVHGLNGFALSNQTNSTLSGLLDANTFEKTLESALKLLFAVAVSAEMVDFQTTDPVDVARDIVTRGFEVNRLWARGTEAGLAVVVVLAAVLTLRVSRRRLELDGEPNSLAAALRLLSASPEFIAAMHNAEFHPPKEILRVLESGGRRYMLDLVPGQGPRVKVVDRAGRSVRAQDDMEYAHLPTPVEEHPEPWVERLWALRRFTGLTYLLCSGLLAALLLAAFLQSRRHDGLPTLFPISSFGYKVMFSYIPIAVGMAIEPALVTLGSSQCMLGPYKALERGHASASVSLAVDYDRSPPHFQLLRSLRTGNIVVAALTISILLSNLLAVAFAGLFTAIPAEVQTSETLKVQTGFTRLSNEMYYVLAKSLESGSHPPTWTTDEFYVVPFYRPGRNSYKGETLGIGVDISCSIVPDEHIHMYCENARTDEPHTKHCPVRDLEYITNYLNVSDPCWDYVSNTEVFGDLWTKDYYQWYHPSGDTLVRSGKCKDRLFVIWVERPASPKPPDPKFPYRDNYKALVLNCMTAEKFVNLTAKISTGQRVDEVSNVRQLDSEEVKGLYSSNPHPDARLPSTFLESVNRSIDSNDLHQIRWFDYLMATAEPRVVRRLKNVTHIPDRLYASEAFEDIYRRLFAINLRLHADTIIPTRGMDGTPIIVLRDRVYVSKLMFYIAAASLLFIISVLLVVYGGQEQQVVGHLPRSLMGMYAHLYASNAKEECALVTGRNPGERASKLGELGGKYAYGRFSNGRHVGVYREGVYRGGVTGEQNHSRDGNGGGGGEEG